MSKSIGIIGLGRCGLPAAEKFIGAGYQVFGYARRPEVIDKFRNLGGIHLENPAKVAAAVGTVIVIVLNDDQVKEVVTGNDGILAGASPGATVICMSTINRANLVWVADQCLQKDVGFVDCPFTGGPARITAGTLTLIAAASSELMEKVKPALEVIGQITFVGDKPGMGQAVKHCNQLLVTAIHAATIELITLAEKTGADPKLVCEVAGSGIGGNDYFRLLSRAILENTTSPGGLGQLWKDVNIIVTTAREHNLPLLVTLATAQYFNMAVAQGMANQDSARLIEVIRKMIEA
jgi:3-hydroxyisobutyrate dehydrogenase-like beta-hydroxyacid dehydrogenase